MSRRSQTVDSYMQAAFSQVCKDAIEADHAWYVCLMERRPYYGGPEEGGWWGTDSILVAYQKFASEDLARSAEQAVEKLAKELGNESRKAFGEQCLREMDWLEERGLEADFLPEPDGESEFSVCVTNELPGNTYGCRHYE